MTPPDRNLDSEAKGVHCSLCPHRCLLKEGSTGLCGVRSARGGREFSLVGNRIAALAQDPVEKKPLYHFFPGSTLLSLGTLGCNLSCLFCQNHDLSFFSGKGSPQAVTGESLSAERLVKEALGCRAAGVAYTYNEPSVFADTFRECWGPAVKEAGLANVWVTNGYMTPETLSGVAPLIEAVNQDLKFFTDEAYHRWTGGSLDPVLKSLLMWREAGVWLEVTTLIIPGLNDAPLPFRQTARWIRENLGRETPWHLSRFFPRFRLDHIPPTPPETLSHLRGIALEEGLHHVYLGNVSDPEGEKTLCPECGRTLIERSGYRVHIQGLKKGRCEGCGALPAGRWERE